MKRKFIIFTLCFTLIFSSLNYKRSYADGGLISLPMLATVSALAVGTGIVISNNDDLYDLGRMFYDYVDKHNTLTWQTVQSVFASNVSLQANKLVSVESDFLDIVKGFFDTKFQKHVELGFYNNLPYYSNISLMYSQYDIPSVIYLNRYDGGTEVLDFSYFGLDFVYDRKSGSKLYYSIYNSTSLVGSVILPYYCMSSNCYEFCFDLKIFTDRTKIYAINGGCSKGHDVVPSSSYTGTWNDVFADSTFPYNGGYTWDNVESKKENDSVFLPVPGDLGHLVGQGSNEFWGNTDNLINDGVVSLPNVSNPSIGLDDSIYFPSVDSDTGVVDPSVPSVPSDSIWSTIKDFIISLFVPSDTFWTDTWGGLYNNFISSFPMVDMDGFNDLVTGEKKFPNIDINIMGVSGRVVNGDVINSIVDWLRPIIAGFMMICLMLFNYRKIYKLIRNTEPFGGIASGTSDFKTGISEYSHIGLVNDGFKRSEDEEFARSRYYEEMHFRNGGKF